MLAESETELRDLIVQNLETCGFLNKIKAELRAGVFLALSEEGDLRKVLPTTNKKLDDFVSSTEGKLALSIVREFLECYNFGFTLSVFDPEIASQASCMTRSDLCKELNLSEDCFAEESVLSALLKKRPFSEMQDSNCDKIKPLEKLNEDFPLSQKDVTNKELLKENEVISLTTSSKLINDIFQNKVEKTLEDVNKSKESIGLAKLSSNKNNSDDDLFSFTKTDEKHILKDNSSSDDPFFDEPVPAEKSNFQFQSSLQESKFLSTSDNKGSLSSLKDLPSLTRQPNIFKGTIESVSTDDFDLHKKDDLTKKDLDPESNEELSDRQLGSEESIEEEIEEDYSAGLDDLLNSSLSLGEDATSDQTVSQASVVDGVDHIESCHSVN